MVRQRKRLFILRNWQQGLVAFDLAFGDEAVFL